MTIVLASTSATRQLLLQGARIPFEVERPHVDEKSVIAANPHWLADDTAVRLAEAKALAVSERRQQDLVIGADQTLLHGGELYGKPSDLQAARRQLLMLRGQSHELRSAICCARGGTILWRHTGVAVLRMRMFSDTFLSSYLDAVGDSCLTSVGAYQLEGPGIQLFDAVEGSFHDILGLPLLPLLAFLRSEGKLAI